MQMSGFPPTAFFFESAGVGEWILFMAVVLIVVGPKRLPAAARKIGKIMSELRRAAQSFKDEIMKLDEPVQPSRQDGFPSEISTDDPSIPDIPEEDGETASLYDHYSRNGYYDGEEPDGELADVDGAAADGDAGTGEAEAAPATPAAGADAAQSAGTAAPEPPAGTAASAAEGAK